MRGIRSIKHAMFTETEEGQTLALIKKLDPTWDLHEMLTSALRPSPFNSASCEAHASAKIARPDLNCLHHPHHRALNGWISIRVLQCWRSRFYRNGSSRSCAVTRKA